MDAGRFSCDIGGDFRFGIKQSNEFADELVKLAEEIRSGELLHQSATISHVAVQDDYFMTKVELVFAPKMKKAETEIGSAMSEAHASLYGPNSMFPGATVEKVE